MSKQRIAIAGSGNLGVPVIKALLAASFQVTVLTRSSGTETSARLTKAGIQAENNPDISYATVDYDSVPSLTKALQGHFAVISTLGGGNIHQQEGLIDAAVAAGVTRFLPSEFGSNTRHPAASELPPFKAKVATATYVAKKAAENPSFSYTLLINGPFFDWGLAMGFLLDPKNRKGTVFDGGDVRFSTTNLDTVGRAIATILSPSHLEQTKNRTVYVHSAVVTQNQIIDIVKKNESGAPKEWQLTQDTVENAKQKAMAGMAKGDFSGMIDLVKVGIFGGEAYGADFSKFGTDNELLGIPMLSNKEVEQVVLGVL